ADGFPGDDVVLLPGRRHAHLDRLPLPLEAEAGRRADGRRADRARQPHPRRRQDRSPPGHARKNPRCRASELEGKAAVNAASRKLYLDKENAKLAGVCAGIADYMGWKKVGLVRAAWIVATVFWAPVMIAAYLLMA